jgi:hypothetical protein
MLRHFNRSGRMLVRDVLLPRHGPGIIMQSELQE